jgi:C4-type Zn-finger protein
MSELDLCPKCKQGHLRDSGGVTIKREIEPPFTQTGSIRERICNQCGHRQVDDRLKEYAEPSSDKAPGTVTRIDPQDKIKE